MIIPRQAEDIRAWRWSIKSSPLPPILLCWNSPDLKNTIQFPAKNSQHWASFFLTKIWLVEHEIPVLQTVDMFSVAAPSLKSKPSIRAMQSRPLLVELAASDSKMALKWTSPSQHTTCEVCCSAHSHKMSFLSFYVMHVWSLATFRPIPPHTPISCWEDTVSLLMCQSMLCLNVNATCHSYSKHCLSAAVHTYWTRWHTPANRAWFVQV